MNKSSTVVKLMHLAAIFKKHARSMFSTGAVFAMAFACHSGCGVTINGDGPFSRGNPVEALMSAYQKAHGKNDVDGLMALYCWDGVPADLRETIRENLHDFMLQPIRDMKIESVDPGQFGETVEGGRRWRKNLPVTGKLIVSFTQQGAFGWTDIEELIGRKGGRCLIVVSIPAN